MDNAQMTARFWDDAWGDLEEYEDSFAEDISELAGFKIGDRVVCIADEAEDPTNPGSTSGYEDDEGTVIAFAAPRKGGGPFNLPSTGHNLYVAFDGMDPTVVDPADVEKIEN